MTKRARELMDFLLVLVDLQHRVEPWSGAQSPAPLSISEMGIQNDDFVPLACVASLTPSRSMEIDPADVARRLQDEAQATDDRGRTLLARIAETWLERTSLTVPALATPLARLASIGRERTRLEQSEVDLTEIDLALLDNDLDGAERAIDALGDARRAAEARAKVKSAQERLRARLEGLAVLEASDLQARLDEIDASLDNASEAELAERQQGVEHELRERLQQYLANRLRNLHADLERIEAPADLLEDLTETEDRALRGQLSDLSALERFEEFVEVRTSELLSIAGTNLMDARERLAVAGETLQSDHRIEFAETIDELDNQLQQLDLYSPLDDIIATHAESEELALEIDKRRLRRWRASEGEELLIGHIIDFCTQQLSFDEEDILKLYVALKSKPFVIIAGLTGTGKSTIVRLFAEAVGATTGNGGFRRIAVRPDWIDQAEVLGFVNPISRHFEPGWLADTVQRCTSSPDRLFVVLLDEMNLAPAEQYLAEFLSAGEEHRSGSGEVRIPLYNPGAPTGERRRVAVRLAISFESARGRNRQHGRDDPRVVGAGAGPRKRHSAVGRCQRRSPHPLPEVCAAMDGPGSGVASNHEHGTIRRTPLVPHRRCNDDANGDGNRLGRAGAY